MTTRWWLSLVYVIAGAALSSCGAGTEPVIPSEIRLGTAVVKFAALGQTQQLSPAVVDAHGTQLPDVAITWQSANAAVAAVTDGLVTANGPGSTYVTASAGAITATIRIDVVQIPTMLRKISGDLQSGVAGAVLPVPLEVEAIDANSHVIAGTAIEFTSSGNATFSLSTVITRADGHASTVATVRRTGTFIVYAMAATTADSDVPVFTTFEISGTSTEAAQILIYGGNNATVPPGTWTHPSLRVTDPFGNGIAGIQVRIDVTAGGGLVRLPGETSDPTSTVVVTSGSEGQIEFEWLLNAVGQHRATATAVDVPLDGSPVPLLATVTNGFISPYNIDLRFVTPVTPSQAQAFANAERRWERHIVGDLSEYLNGISEVCGDGTPNVSGPIDDVLILVELVPIDGLGGRLASAGPCILRSENDLPLVGLMHFDVADLQELESEGLMQEVVTHEMGHVFGIGTLWEWKELLVDPKHAGGTDPHFIGAQATTAFNAAGGATYVGGEKVPVEDAGGPGTADAHWRESVFNNELMTGYINLGTNPLSAITLRSLRDIGYTVDVSGADAFTLGPALRLPGRAPMMLEDDIRRGPIRRVAPGEALGRPVR